jgi:hypothetical protein
MCETARMRRAVGPLNCISRKRDLAGERFLARRLPDGFIAVVARRMQNGAGRKLTSRTLPTSMSTVLSPKRPKSKARTLSRTDVNFCIDLLLLVLFLALAWSSVVLRFVFPPGAVAAGWTLWHLGYDDWAGIQFGTLSVFALTVLLHVMLHWSWVCGVVSKYMAKALERKKKSARQQLDEGNQTLYGVGLLIVIVNLLGLAIAAAALCIRSP